MFCTPTPRQNFPATPLRIATHNGKDLDANAVLIDDVKLDCVGPLPSQTKAFLQCRIQELVVGNGWSVEPLTSPPLCPFPSLFFILLSAPLKSCWLGRSPVAKNTMHFDFWVKIVSGCNNLPRIYDDVTVKFRDGGIFHAQKNCCMPVGIHPFHLLWIRRCLLTIAKSGYYKNACLYTPSRVLFFLSTRIYLFWVLAKMAPGTHVKTRNSLWRTNTRRRCAKGQLGQLSLASLWGRLIEYQLRLG